MVKPKKKIILTIIQNIFRITVFLIIIHRLFGFSQSAKCIQYNKIIDASEVEEIKKTEKNILGQIKDKVGKETNNIEESEFITIESAKKEVDDKEELCKTKEKELEKAQPPLSKEEKTAQLVNLKNDYQQTKKNYETKLNSLREKVKNNIQENLEKNGLIITELDDNSKEGLGKAIWKDPQRYLFITPLQKVLRTVGIKEEKNQQFFLLDMLFKVLIMRLLIWLVSYPEGEDFFGGSSLREAQEAQSNPYLTTEEKEAIMQRATGNIKYVLANFGFSFFFTFFMISHPFFFDQTNSTHAQKTGIFPWVIFSFLAICFSLTSYHFLHREKKFPNWSEVKIYWKKSWISFFISTLLSLAFLSYFGRTQGSYLYSIFGEVVNFIINIIRLSFLRAKKKRLTY